MEYKKIIIPLILAIFLLGITSVCASEMDDAIASEDINSVELSIDEIDEDNLKTDDENIQVAGDDETQGVKKDEGNYSTLAREIGSGGNVELSYDHYTYDECNTIIISVNNSVIDGKGAVIDMAESNIRAFNVTASGVTIKNLVIKNANYAGKGGAIYFAGQGNLTNCNFTGNKATGGEDSDGGAVYFDSDGTVTNCSFTDNCARGSGGALNINGKSTVANCNFTNNKATGNNRAGGAAFFMDNSVVTNCNFINNYATFMGGAFMSFQSLDYSPSITVANSSFINNTVNAERSSGGAIYSVGVTAINCNFINNSATESAGAVYAFQRCNVVNCNFENNIAGSAGAIESSLNAISADTCIFKTESDTTNNVRILSPSLNVDNFTTFYGSGEKLTLDLKTNSGIPVTDGHVSISVYFKDSNAWVGNYTCSSGEEWSVDLPVGSYYAIFDTEYAGFKAINRTITITMPNVKHYVNVTSIVTDNRTVNITAKSNILKGILWGGKMLFILPNGTEITADYAGNGTWWALCSFDELGEYEISAKYVGLENAAVNNGTVNLVEFKPVYSSLFYEIKSGGDIVLRFDHYTYDEGDTITIAQSGVIDGRGAVIDMAGSNIRAFTVAVSGVTIKNLTIRNVNYARHGGALYFCEDGFVSDSNFINNTVTDDDSCGGAVYFNGNGMVVNCCFTNNTATSDGGAVYFDSWGSVMLSNFTDNKVIDSDGWGGAVVIYGGGNVINSNFNNNHAARNGGAVYFFNYGNVVDCNFNDNMVGINGGALYFRCNGSVTNSKFTDNKATGAYGNGGAVYVKSNIDITDSNFTGNMADMGSAIYLDHEGGSTDLRNISNSIFLNNKANMDSETPFNVTMKANNMEIRFQGNDNILNAIFSDIGSKVNITNVTYWGANGIENTGEETIVPVMTFNEAGQNITVNGVVNGISINVVKRTDNDGKIVLENVSGEYRITVSHDEDSYYSSARILFTNRQLSLNVTEITTTNTTVNITAESEILGDIMPCEVFFITSDGYCLDANYAGNGTWWALHTFDNCGIYKVNASFGGDYNVSIRNGTITVNKLKTEITGSAITATYNVNKYLVITLKDSSGKVLSGVEVTVEVNGAKTYTTDKNGQVKVTTKGLAPKTYAAKVTFNGNAFYEKSAKEIKVTIKKATPKVTAKKKTFKRSVKVKKYSIVLKNNVGKAIKKAKVTIKIGKKTYTAKTNSKGKATFKIKKLIKKGKYKAKISYKGNKYYNKVTKKVNIRIK